MLDASLLGLQQSMGPDFSKLQVPQLPFRARGYEDSASATRPYSVTAISAEPFKTGYLSSTRLDWGSSR